MLAREIIQRHSPSIPLKEVSFHPHSFADDAGRLFWWKGELYRGITSEQSAFYAKLFSGGVIDYLVGRGLLIETEPTDLTLEGYALVVRHQTAPFVSYPHEWSAAMLKDAALTIIDLTIELAERGLTLKDAHPWNLVFRAAMPVYVDLTSIVPLRNEPTWSAFEEFRRFCYYPLVLMSHGHERIARTLLPEYEGVLRTELMTIMRGSGLSRFMLSKLLDRGLNSIQSMFAKTPGSRRSFVTRLKRVRQDLEKIRLPSYERRRHELLNESATSPDFRSDWPHQRQAIQDVLTGLRPATVLDLSRGPMWTSVLPAAMGFNVVSIGAEPARATAIYEKARDKSLQILPLIVDFIKPTPSIGYSNHYSISSTRRLKCDMVLALGLAHRIASQNHFSPDLIAEGLSSFSKRWLLVEFAERELTCAHNAPGGWRGSRPLDEFINALRKRFCEVRIVSSGTKAGVLLLCEKKPGG